MKSYQETLDYIYKKTPVYQHIGGKAYKEGLDNIIALDNYFKHPHRKYKCVHVGGTNGKGSVSHSLAAILQSCGYKVGLYTSPHLKDFSERIRVNGKAISQNFIIDFVNQTENLIENMSLSFFELTTMMAFCYFEEQKVDIAIIEVGLGGRLDSTNIINPIASVITNISYDHMNILGNTLEKIASEKAGIIKKSTPIIIGETVSETKPIFISKANELNASISFAEDELQIISIENKEFYTSYRIENFGLIDFELQGFCQQKNILTILNTINILKTIAQLNIPDNAIKNGLAKVIALTGLTGRWQVLQHQPLVIVDTAHNQAGIEWVVKQLKSIKHEKLHIVIGLVNDKDSTNILNLLPTYACYYFTQANIHRALDANELKQQANKIGLHGNAYNSVIEAKIAAIYNAKNNDLVFIGGSNFVVAEAI